MQRARFGPFPFQVREIPALLGGTTYVGAVLRLIKLANNDSGYEM